MDELDLTQADLSRLSGISPAQISRLLNGLSKPGPDACLALAHALHLSPETVFRAAGILPPKPTQDETSEIINYQLSRLPRRVREQIAEYVNYIYERHAPADADEAAQPDR